MKYFYFKGRKCQLIQNLDNVSCFKIWFMIKVVLKISYIISPLQILKVRSISMYFHEVLNKEGSLNMRTLFLDSQTKEALVMFQTENNRTP